MPLRLLVDAEMLVITGLRTVAEVATLVGIRVYYDIPPEPTYPFLRVVRIGGVPVMRQHLDAARIQIDAWAMTKAAARTLAATAQAATYSLVGVHNEGVVTAVRDDLGLTWAPDDLTDRPRYTFGVVVYTHPTPD